MKTRFNLLSVVPQAYQPMLEFERLLADAELDHIHREMIKIRTSQLNGCAYCLNAHTKDALKYGEQPQRIFVLTAWREARNWFSDEEQAILELTEEITLISQHGVSDAVFDNAVKLFGEKTTAQIILAIVTMNCWNRLAVGFAKHPA